MRVEKRRNPSRMQKEAGIFDPWYMDAHREHPEDKWIFASVDGTFTDTWPDGEHCCEAIGPSIGTNPLGLAKNICYPFDLLEEKITRFNVPRSFEGLAWYLGEVDSYLVTGKPIEGIVFHHPDGRRAKIKRRDFGL